MFSVCRGKWGAAVGTDSGQTGDCSALSTGHWGQYLSCQETGVTNHFYEDLISLVDFSMRQCFYECDTNLI